jgi:hypothetical protein
MEALQLLAERHGFECEIRDQTLHWHGATWLGEGEAAIVETLWYAGGPDTTGLSLDMDFRLPVPSSGKAGVMDRWLGVANWADIPMMTQGTQEVAISQFYVKWLSDPDRAGALMRDEVGPILTDNIVAAKDKMTRAFIEKHLRAFQLTHKGPGNPRLRARALVKIKGTYNPIVDGVWQIWEAKHDLSGDGGYETTIHLRRPSKAASPKGGWLTLATWADRPMDAQRGKEHTALLYVQNANVLPSIPK